MQAYKRPVLNWSARMASSFLCWRVRSFSLRCTWLERCTAAPGRTTERAKTMGSTCTDRPWCACGCATERQSGWGGMGGLRQQTILTAPELIAPTHEHVPAISKLVGMLSSSLPGRCQADRQSHGSLKQHHMAAPTCQNLLKPASLPHTQGKHTSNMQQPCKAAKPEPHPQRQQGCQLPSPQLLRAWHKRQCNYCLTPPVLSPSPSHNF